MLTLRTTDLTITFLIKWLITDTLGSTYLPTCRGANEMTVKALVRGNSTFSPTLPLTRHHVISPHSFLDQPLHLHSYIYHLL